MAEETKSRDTVGKISTDLLIKPLETTDPIEQTNEQLTDYDKNLSIAVDRGLKEYVGDFFLVVLTKKERLMQNVIRNYFFSRKTCPTPEYDQVVYHYHRTSGDIEFIWVVPSKDTCELFKDNMLKIVSHEQQLLKYVLSFYDGTLLDISKRYNGEKPDSPYLIH
jgi:hypothetical protein